MPILVSDVKDTPFDVRPKFLERVGRHASREAFRRSQQRVRRIGLAVSAPSVREEVISGYSHVTGVGGTKGAMAPPGSYGEPHYVYDPSLQGPVRRAKVARILSENEAGACFNGISRDNTGFEYSITVGEASPVSLILLGPIKSGSEGR